MVEKERKGWKHSPDILLELETKAKSQQQKQGCRHQPAASTAWVARSHLFCHWKWNSIMQCQGAAVEEQNFSAMKALPYQSAQKQTGLNLSLITVLSSFALTGVVIPLPLIVWLPPGSVSSSVQEGNWTAWYLSSWDTINSLHPRGKKLFPGIWPTRPQCQWVLFQVGTKLISTPLVGAGCVFFSLSWGHLTTSPKLDCTPIHYGLPVSHCWGLSLVQRQYCGPYESAVSPKRTVIRGDKTIHYLGFKHLLYRDLK